MENLYNEAYSLLPMEEKKEILKNLAKKYNMELLRFETFSKYSKSTFTAVLNFKRFKILFRWNWRLRYSFSRIYQR